jgi:hypothetical protein
MADAVRLREFLMRLANTKVGTPGKARQAGSLQRQRLFKSKAPTKTSGLCLTD